MIKKDFTFPPYVLVGRVKKWNNKKININFLCLVQKKNEKMKIVSCVNY